MLLPIKNLLGTPIMSLQTGAELAHTTHPIIDPRKMTIIAFYVEGSLLESNPSVLHVSDIRELSDIGLIIDDSDKLMATEGLVRLQEIIDFEFELDGVQVVDEREHKLGKVADYAIDPDTYMVQQIYTEQSLIRSLSRVSNIIHRSQIISVTNEKIVVKSPTVPATEISENIIEKTFVNPFRAKPQQETINQGSSRQTH